MNPTLISLFKVRPNPLEEFPWLTASRRKRRRVRLVLYGRAGFVLSLLALPQIVAIKFGATSSAAPAVSASSSKAARPKTTVIDQPFAPASFRKMTAQDAELWNSRVPGNPLASAPARPLAISLQNVTFSRSLQCLTAAVYYEAGNEPLDGRRAVAQVVLNRVRHPEYPHTVCGVVFQGSERKTGCQFSFTCDGSLQRKPSPVGWRDAESIATAALQGFVYAPVGWSTHYHADYVVPYWAQGLQKLVTVGRHIFYRWSGTSGESRSFTSQPQTNEPEIALIHPTGEDPVSDPLLPNEISRVASINRPIISATRPPASLIPGRAIANDAALEAPPSAQAASVKPTERWIIAPSSP